MSENYKEINKKLWNEKTEIHINSEFYGMDKFLAGETSLKEIEIGLLGDITGKSILHLQCHFGQDSLSLARMGAQVTGLDISDIAIEKAKILATQMGLPANFICSDVYSAKQHIYEKFDIVFATYGTIGWLPDIKKWADIVSHFLKPGGKLVFVELHPVLWMYDTTFNSVIYRYFNSEPIVEETPGTYADKEADIQLLEIGWNHGLSEVITSLLEEGLVLNDFKEYDYSPHNCFLGMEKVGESRYIIEHLGNKLPMTYSLVMTKQ
jgi:2-polyprenyl-3-methyl-5-hydroxy-6-metoxy-1,4-benzoquinol methylase